MKLAISAALLSVALAGSLGAQSSSTDAPPTSQGRGMHPGGPHGMRFGHGMAGHRVETVTNSPFTAQFADTVNFASRQGKQEQRSATSIVYRDSQGRVREEVTLPPPPPHPPDAADSATAPAAPRGPRSIITILDPVAHTITHLNVDRQTAYVQTVPADFFTRMQQRASSLESGQDPQQKRDNVTVTSLGNKMFAGISATGEQRVIALPPQDNGGAHTVTRQDWSSTDFKFEVSSSVTSDRGTHTDSLISFNKAEPNPSLFQVPPDYTTTTTPDHHFPGHRRGGPGAPGGAEGDDVMPPPPSM